MDAGRDELVRRKRKEGRGGVSEMLLHGLLFFVIGIMALALEGLLKRRCLTLSFTADGQVCHLPSILQYTLLVPLGIECMYHGLIWSVLISYCSQVRSCL